MAIASSCGSRRGASERAVGEREKENREAGRRGDRRGGELGVRRSESESESELGADARVGDRPRSRPRRNRKLDVPSGRTRHEIAGVDMEPDERRPGRRSACDQSQGLSAGSATSVIAHTAASPRCSRSHDRSEPIHLPSSLPDSPSSCKSLLSSPKSRARSRSTERRRGDLAMEVMHRALLRR